jgi:hypothetical protein
MELDPDRFEQARWHSRHGTPQMITDSGMTMIISSVPATRYNTPSRSLLPGALRTGRSKFEATAGFPDPAVAASSGSWPVRTRSGAHRTAQRGGEEPMARAMACSAAPTVCATARRQMPNMRNEAAASTTDRGTGRTGPPQRSV